MEDTAADEAKEMRKRLWLRIARHVVESSDDGIKTVIGFLSKSSGLIKIEDILPFFPAFTKIDEFKEEIFNSLDEYNATIDQLSVEMNDASKSSERLRRDQR